MGKAFQIEVNDILNSIKLKSTTKTRRPNEGVSKTTNIDDTFSVVGSLSFLFLDMELYGL